MCWNICGMKELELSVFALEILEMNQLPVFMPFFILANQCNWNKTVISWALIFPFIITDIG